MVPVFRKFKREDVYQFAKWGEHSDPRFYQYNFPFETKAEFDDWYEMKQKWIFRKVYGLFLDDYPLGFITIKNINWFKKQAELGIAIDPNHLNEGYGAQLLEAYLEYVFRVYPIEKMALRVAVFNERAKACYEKVGFREVRRQIEVFEEQGYKDIVLDAYPDLFQLVYGELCTEFITMVVEKRVFLSERQSAE